MIHGVVNANCEVTIPLVIRNESSQTRVIDAVIDTGYTGFLSLPSEIITALNFPWTRIDRGTLGDGSEVTFEVYSVTAIWNGEYRNIPVNEAETDPLVGMSLLYDLRIQVVEGGNVLIEALTQHKLSRSSSTAKSTQECLAY
jgi:clan AA aspartic protease